MEGSFGTGELNTLGKRTEWNAAVLMETVTKLSRLIPVIGCSFHARRPNGRRAGSDRVRNKGGTAEFSPFADFGRQRAFARAMSLARGGLKKRRTKT